MDTQTAAVRSSPASATSYTLVLKLCGAAASLPASAVPLDALLEPRHCHCSPPPTVLVVLVLFCESNFFLGLVYGLPSLFL